jgi:hydroxymethylpyrimidine/phosphomethylpyrimidine kinase
MAAVLCIGGWDPLGRAGLLADRAACAAAGADFAGVCSALTAQDDSAALAWPVSAERLAAQLRICFGSASFGAVKTGWLADAAQIEALLAALPAGLPLIVDPLLATSSGQRVYQGSTDAEPYRRLLGRADLITPNLPEAHSLLGLTYEDPAECATALAGRGMARVLLKGGHGDGAIISDIFVDSDRSIEVFRQPRQVGVQRGTGCRLASFCAAAVAQDRSYANAVAAAIRWLSGQIVATAAAAAAAV